VTLETRTRLRVRARVTIPLAATILVLAVLVPVCVTIGARQSNRSSSTGSPSNRRLVTAGLTPNLWPEYRRAVALFERKDYPGAERAIERLLADPKLAEAERAFLMRQQAICAAAEKGNRPSPAVIGAQADRGAADCGPRALDLVLAQLGRERPLEELTQRGGTNRVGTTLAGLKRAAESEGLAADAVQMDLPALQQMKSKAVAWVDGDHYVAVLAAGDDEILIHDPNHQHEERIPTEELLRRSGGIVLTLSPATTHSRR